MPHRGLLTWGDTSASLLDDGIPKTHLFRIIPWTWGMDAVAAEVVGGPQWVHLTRAHNVRVKPIEVKPPPVEWGQTEED